MLDEEETKQLDAFREYLEENKLSLPDSFTIRDAYRFLYTINDHENTYKNIIKQHEFFVKRRPVDMNGLDELINSGIVYVWNRDKFHRPISTLLSSS